MEQPAREQDLEMELEVLRLEEEEEQKRQEETERKWNEEMEKWARSTGRVGRGETRRRGAPRQWRSPRAGTAQRGSRSASERGEWAIFIFILFTDLLTGPDARANFARAERFSVR